MSQKLITPKPISLQRVQAACRRLSIAIVRMVGRRGGHGADQDCSPEELTHALAGFPRSLLEPRSIRWRRPAQSLVKKAYEVAQFGGGGGGGGFWLY